MGRTSDAKEKLLQTATELMWEHSYGTVSVDQICARAGVKKGSFYHFFPSKSELAVAALEEHWQKNRACLDEMFSAQVSPLDRLRNYCAYTEFRQHESRKKSGKVLGCPYISIGCELSTQDEQVRRKAEELFARTHRYFEAALRDATREGLIPRQNYADQASSILSLVIGRMLEARIKNNVAGLKRLYPSMLQLLGAKPPQ
jgi:TetR/AcrR family transcriptional regulator, transcriptional repressor for nem operon